MTAKEDEQLIYCALMVVIQITSIYNTYIYIYIEAYGDGIIVVVVDVNDEDDEDDEVVTVIGVSTLGC